MPVGLHRGVGVSADTLYLLLCHATYVSFMLMCAAFLCLCSVTYTFADCPTPVHFSLYELVCVSACLMVPRLNRGARLIGVGAQNEGNIFGADASTYEDRDGNITELCSCVKGGSW